MQPAGTAATKQAQDYYSAVAAGGPAAYRASGPQIDFTKTAFTNARRTLAQTAPAGGASAAGNRQLAGTEAQTISSLYTNNIKDAMEKLTGIGSTETGQALGATGGISGVSDAMSKLAAQQMGAWASGLGGLAGAFGTYFGLKG